MTRSYKMYILEKRCLIYKEKNVIIYKVLEFFFYSRSIISGQNLWSVLIGREKGSKKRKIGIPVRYQGNGDRVLIL